MFENSEHDFPKKIVYQLIDGNNMEVLVTGDKTEGFKIEYTRKYDN